MINLGTLHRQLGRCEAALAPMEEAIGTCRKLVERGDPTIMPILASALNNLGVHHRDTGQPEQALAPIEEAVRIRRAIVENGNPALRHGLAKAMATLGTCHHALGRLKDAVAFAEDAVEIHQALVAEGNTWALPQLAVALHDLEGHHLSAGHPERSSAAWTSALEQLAGADRAALLVQRAQHAPPGTTVAVGWLSRALAFAGTDAVVIRHVREAARRHDDADPWTWRAAWRRTTGETVTPEWTSVDRLLLAAAREWLSCPSPAAEHTFLTEHHQLLLDAADAAVEEALLWAEPSTALRSRSLRRIAQREGVDSAYRPLLRQSLARAFAAATPLEQRDLLAGHRNDLLSDEARGHLDTAAAAPGAPLRVLIARAVLDVAATTHDPAFLEALFDAIIGSGPFAPLFSTIIRDIGPAEQLAGVALLALLRRPDDDAAAHACLMAAVAAAEQDDLPRARALLDTAAECAPAERMAWSRLLLPMRDSRPVVLELIEHLLAEPPGPSEPAKPIGR